MTFSDPRNLGLDLHVSFRLGGMTFSAKQLQIVFAMAAPQN
jgi:hypothetical protein